MYACVHALLQCACCNCPSHSCMLSPLLPTLIRARRGPQPPPLSPSSPSSPPPSPPHPRHAPSRHCRGARVYGHTTTAIHEVEYISPIEYTPPRRPSLLPCLLTYVPSTHPTNAFWPFCCCCCFDEKNALAFGRRQLRDKLQSKQAVCITQLEDNQQKMQGLGTLPHDQHDQYKVSSSCARLSFSSLLSSLPLSLSAVLVYVAVSFGVLGVVLNSDFCHFEFR